MSDLELLAIGDATMDAYMTPTESETLCQINNKDCLICFSYGDKIPVRNLDFSVGGNAANNAVGAKRLGVKSGLIATLGTDLTGDQIVKKLMTEGVDLTHLDREENSESNYSTVINYSGERTIFTYHAKRNYEFPETLQSAPWMYLTSMGDGFEGFYGQFAEFMKGHSEIKLGFNPGSRQIRAGTESLKNILEVAFLVYVNRQEAETLTGTEDSAGKEKDLLKALSALGPKSCVITDGGNGSFVFDGQKFLKAGVLPVDAFERTGAGDSFGSGMLSALIKGKPFEEALLWGTVNSASVIGYIGPQKGLLKEEEIPVWLERAKSCNVVVEEF